MMPLIGQIDIMSKKLLFTLEFPVRCSPAILFEFLSTASGLQEWFADKVDEWENVFSFSWNGGTPDKAEILDQEENKFIRFKYHIVFVLLVCHLCYLQIFTAIQSANLEGKIQF